MKEKHSQLELQFYKNAYSDNQSRRERGYGWEFEPSRVVLELFEKHLGKKRQKDFRVLDVGCGDGRHLSYFSDLGLDATGVDFSIDSIKLCQKRFRGCPNVHLKKVDLIQRGALEDLGQFDLIIEWSVMDHIRKEYIKLFKKNILNTLKCGGYLISAQLAHPFPEHLKLQKNRNYRIKNGHYVKAYSTKDLIASFPELKVIDQRNKILEDEKNNFLVNTVIFQKE